MKKFRIFICLMVSFIVFSGCVSKGNNLYMSMPRFKREKLLVEDLEYFKDFVLNYQADSFRNISKEEFILKVDKLKSNIKNLDNDEFVVELMKITKFFNDSHSCIQPTYRAIFPFELETLYGNFYITSVNGEYFEYYLYRIKSINGVDISKIVELLKEIVPADNEYGVMNRMSLYLLDLNILKGVGVIDKIGETEFVLEKNGVKKTIKVKPVENKNLEVVETDELGNFNVTEFSKKS